MGTSDGTRIAFWAVALPLLVLVQVDDFGTVSLAAVFAAAITTTF